LVAHDKDRVGRAHGGGGGKGGWEVVVELSADVGAIPESVKTRADEEDEHVPRRIERGGEDQGKWGRSPTAN